MKLDQSNNYFLLERERLQREIAQREAQLKSLNASDVIIPDKIISESLSRRRRYIGGSYLVFLMSGIKESKAYTFWERILKYFRRYRLIATIIRIVIYVITTISTGAFFLSYISVIILALPFLLVTGITGAFASLMDRKRILQQLRSIGEPSITIIFMPLSLAQKTEYSLITNTTKRLSLNNDIIFFVKSNGRKDMSVSETNKSYCIKLSDYFYFNKHFFSRINDITVIHL